MNTKAETSKYDAVCAAILAIPKFTKEKHDFSVIRAYLDAMGHPEAGIRVIHVAGTNGKGSVTRMLTSFLMEAGRRTGSFYSPHLVRMNERIRVNEEDIPDDALVRAWEKIEEIREKRNLPQLTFFEVLFVMALLYFQEAGVTDAVLETGLGGRLDATTSIPADLYVITRIGMDHEAQLGSTISEVAFEKAGIITGDSPLVFHSDAPSAGRTIPGETSSAGQNPQNLSETEAVIYKKAREMRCRFISDCNRISVIIHRKNRVGIDFSFSNGYYSYDHLFLSTGAVYQTENAVTAITAARYLFPDLSPGELDELIRRALKGFSMPGRLEEIAPGVYTDGAHNPSAAGELRKSLETLFGSKAAEADREKDIRKKVLIFAASSDKDYEGVLQRLLDYSWDRILMTRYQSDRAVLADVLKQAAESFAGERTVIETADSLTDALLMAGVDFSKKTAEANGEVPGRDREKPHFANVLITGSLYLVGEAKALLNG